MDEIYKAISNKFGNVDTRFLAQDVSVLDLQNPITLLETESVRNAIKILKEKRIGCLLITDKAGALKGIISERDIVMGVCLEDMDLDKTPISKVMTANPHAEPRETTVAFCLHLMAQGGYRHIPLVEGNKVPIAVISVKDIVSFIEGEIVKQLVLSELEA